MKVTKAIREFIEQQIAIREEETLAPLKKKQDERMAEIRAEYEKVEKEMNDMLKPILDKYCITDKLVVLCPHLEYYLPEVEAYRKERERVFRNRRSITTEIIAEMELGGTKAELMEKIANIKF